MEHQVPSQELPLPHSKSGPSSEDPPEPELGYSGQGMDFPSLLRNGVPQPVAMITHHSQRLPKLPKPTAGLQEPHPGGAARRGRALASLAWAQGSVLGLWKGQGTLPGGIQVGSMLCPLPMAALATRLALNCAGTRRWRVGAMNSFPFMICYDDTPEG